MPELLPKTEHEDHLPIVAHKGMVELIDASWNLTKGRTVKFRLVDDAAAPLIVHPFTQFVRRRGNRPGTRFNATFVRYGMEDVFYQGEIMLMSGGNPLGQGMWVSFWLDAEGGDHPFAGCTGRGSDHPGDMFAVVFVELDDDDEPINQEKRRRLEAVRGNRGGALARLAGQWCSNEQFLQYLSEKVQIPKTTKEQPTSRPVDWWRQDDRAARWIRWMCGIESRADLDHNAKAAETFHEKIRLPFMDWKNHSED